MKKQTEGWQDAWQRWPRALDAAWSGVTTAEERAALVAGLLAELPPVEMAACRLDMADGAAALAVRPERRAADAALRRALLDWRADGPPPWPAELGDLKPEAAALTGARGGLVAVALRRRAAAAARAALPALLSLAADGVALRLRLDAARAECTALAEPALIGEAAGALIHDLNNHLNGMVLQAAIVQARVDPALRDSLNVIRQGGAKASVLLRPIAQARARRRERREAVDLNAVVRRVAGAARLRTDVAEGLPPLSADTGDVRRLVELLIRVAGLGPDGVLRTGRDGEVVFLIAEGSALAEEDPAAPSLERLALRSLVRLTHGQVDFAGGAAALRVTWGPPEESV